MDGIEEAWNEEQDGGFGAALDASGERAEDDRDDEWHWDEETRTLLRVR